MSKLQLAHFRKNSEKKSSCTSAIEIIPGDLVIDTPSFALAVPERSFIKSINIVEEADSDIGVLKIQYIKDGAAVDLIAAAAADDPDGDSFEEVSANDAAHNDVNLMAPAGGLDVWITAATDMTKGRVFIIVEYVEYALSTGHLTSINSTLSSEEAKAILA